MCKNRAKHEMNFGGTNFNKSFTYDVISFLVFAMKLYLRLLVPETAAAVAAQLQTKCETKMKDMAKRASIAF